MLTADTKPCPTRPVSRLMNQASRFPVRLAELARAPQYLDERASASNVHRICLAVLALVACTHRGRVIHIRTMINAVARVIIRKYSLRKGANPGEKTVWSVRAAADEHRAEEQRRGDAGLTAIVPGRIRRFVGEQRRLPRGFVLAVVSDVLLDDAARGLERC